jgi:hypothetical protein
VNGRFISYLKFYGLSYMIDERTLVGLIAEGDNVPYQEILDSINITKAPEKPTKYAPYIQ